MKGEWHKAKEQEPFIPHDIGTTCAECLHFLVSESDYPCNKCKRNPMFEDMYEKGS